MIQSTFFVRCGVSIVAFVLILALSALSSVAQDIRLLLRRRQAPPHQWPRSHNYDVQNYRIVLSFDWTKQSIAGETTITFQPRQQRKGNRN